MIIRYIFIILITLLALTNNVIGAEIIPISELKFGTIAVQSKSSNKFISISQDGDITFAGITPLTFPERAEFLLQDFPKNTTLNVVAVITTSEISEKNSSSSFKLVKLFYDKTVKTSNEGKATIFIGARIEPSSAKNHNSKKTYNSYFSLSIN